MMASKRQARFAAGKIPPETLLRTVYNNLGRRDKRVLVGPGIGRDSAAVKQNGTVLVFDRGSAKMVPMHHSASNRKQRKIPRRNR
jgi:hypothetical protein